MCYTGKTNVRKNGYWSRKPHGPWYSTRWGDWASDWGSTTQMYLIDKLEFLQNKASRLISGSYSQQSRIRNTKHDIALIQLKTRRKICLLTFRKLFHQNTSNIKYLLYLFIKYLLTSTQVTRQKYFFTHKSQIQSSTTICTFWVGNKLY